MTTHLSVGPHPCRAGRPIDPVVTAWWSHTPPTAVYDLTTPAEGHGSYADTLAALSPAAVRRSFPIPDMAVPTAPQLIAILDALDADFGAGATCYLHCAAGIGRSGLVVTALHMRHGMSLVVALAHIRALRAHMRHPGAVPESAAQRSFLESWHE